LSGQRTGADRPVKPYLIFAASKKFPASCRFSQNPLVVFAEADQRARFEDQTPRRRPMRFMVIVKATEDSEAGVMPS
jgi:hypothetical protein